MKLIHHGLTLAGRYMVLRVVTNDRPGELARLTARVAELGLNVLDVEHHRAGARVAFDEVEVLLTLETRSTVHASEIAAALTGDGTRVDVVR
jgi:threonine dehydratase